VTTTTTTTAEQAGDILGNNSNPWGIARMRSPTIIDAIVKKCEKDVSVAIPVDG